MVMRLASRFENLKTAKIKEYMLFYIWITLVRILIRARKLITEEMHRKSMDHS
jgi:hypothetical protein